MALIHFTYCFFTRQAASWCLLTHGGEKNKTRDDKFYIYVVISLFRYEEEDIKDNIGICDG